MGNGRQMPDNAGPTGKRTAPHGDLRSRLSASVPGSRPFLQKALRTLPLAVSPPAITKHRAGKPGTLVFGPVPKETVLQFARKENLDKLTTRLNEQILLDEVRDSKMSFWLVYENDGASPNLGSGSDQGPTARLAMYVTWDKKRAGLTKLGVTVVDIRTPRGHLDGQKFESSSTYRAAKGPYSGFASVDFEVTMMKSSHLQLNLLGSAGIDSTAWGKFVQDAIHEWHYVNSPLFPHPDTATKPFGEIGVSALVTPKRALSQSEVLGVKYKGTVEFDAKAVTGTHRTEATAGARFVLRSSTVETQLGQLSAEFSPIGAFARGFIRYNDGRENGRFGVEAGVNSSFMVNIGRFGIGFESTILKSTDPALQTDNPTGSQPFLSPLRGGPKGHHGQGKILLRWKW